MPILARYILRTVFAYMALVLAVLLVLGGLFLFVNEQDVRFLEGECTPDRSGDEVTILPAFAGG